MAETEDAVMYRDVLRVETNRNGLQNILRKKQLGFERVPSDGGGYEIRMGYKDSSDNMHYFTKDNEFASEYWKPDGKNIYFNDTGVISGGKAAIGRKPDAAPFEVQCNNPSNTESQIRLSFDNSNSADIGVASTGMFRIKVGYSERMYLYSNGYKIHTYSSKIENSGNNTEFWTDSNGQIRINAGYQGLVLGAHNGEIIFQHSSATIGKIEYSYSNEMIVAADNKANDLRLKSRDYGNIILDYGNTFGNGVIFSTRGNNFAKMSFSNSTGETLLESLYNGTSIKLKTGAQDCLSVNGSAVSVKTNFLQLPVKENAGHPEGGYQNGYSYVNAAEKKIYVYIDGVWHEVGGSGDCGYGETLKLRDSDFRNTNERVSSSGESHVTYYGNYTNKCVKLRDNFCKNVHLFYTDNERVPTIILPDATKLPLWTELFIFVNCNVRQNLIVTGYIPDIVLKYYGAYRKDVPQGLIPEENFLLTSGIRDYDKVSISRNSRIIDSVNGPKNYSGYDRLSCIEASFGQIGGYLKFKIVEDCTLDEDLCQSLGTLRLSNGVNRWALIDSSSVTQWYNYGSIDRMYYTTYYGEGLQGNGPHGGF